MSFLGKIELLLCNVCLYKPYRLHAQFSIIVASSKSDLDEESSPMKMKSGPWMQARIWRPKSFLYHPMENTFALLIKNNNNNKGKAQFSLSRLSL